MELLKCNRCSKSFSCGAAISSTCWCRELPPLLSVNEGDSCLCKTCLVEEANRKIEVLVGEWKAGKLKEGMFQDYQTSKSVEGIDFYMGKGNLVFTQWYHLKRGYCCESGCRHCPYGFQR
ncbi:MAG: DUF5522 domain-containing protein [Cyclobacteriaceae bacterium]